ncbi:MAG: hypothetical protein WCD53_08425 [Microcoleus sp.]
MTRQSTDSRFAALDRQIFGDFDGLGYAFLLSSHHNYYRNCANAPTNLNIFNKN